MGAIESITPINFYITQFYLKSKEILKLHVYKNTCQKKKKKEVDYILFLVFFLNLTTIKII